MDTLERFLDWFFTSAPPIGFVPLFEAVRKIEDVTAVLWYRKAPYQVQMFIVPPNYVIPEHRHPNVDSVEVYVGGQIKFSHKGKWVIADPSLCQPDEDGLPLKRGTTIRVRPDDLHGGVFGASGGVFLSVQQWLNGVQPHCVAADYDGVVMGPDHYQKVAHGRPFLKRNLSRLDAASLELT